MDSGKVAITTVTYNNRSSLKLVVDALLNQTAFEDDDMISQTTWFIIMQNCTDEFVEDIISRCKDKIQLVICRFEKNIGLSKAMRYVVERTKYYEYVLNLEDDWILLESHIQSNKRWLYDCVDFMTTHSEVSTLFLRAYATEKEKWQYGWLRSIPYVCHKFPNNFNYQDKINKANTCLLENGHKFHLIPEFLFTFNPCLVRNADYHLHAYPIPEYNNDQKDPNHNTHWGWCEAILCERTRHLISFWFNNGIFGHHEDWFPTTSS